ncbi:carbon-phosphorus lyase complex subunit PhnI [Alicyclobacillus fastidiosus]|uniref:Carbon-phosphorus lyase complex subunit PhnI n=1 Tax=Alicyclobacillus fastidiosus TaxID=392011 RepID=A0ABY6ZMR9_9BACL|nr:carbon-phosphorus lyase complex subunit PhnI [Alicyclobacillus fastidiosus]WAH44125.1 carbon-phosphorus lyase complex subunit PhnI [Alicyclobacillus fastidiosus]GMA60426.1 carbon-phosphorus lyase complex subunit PhnI [Alicyclobacillus fastidiosus]
MGYTTVTGGQEAIEKSHQLVDLYRLADAKSPMQVAEIKSQLQGLVDKVISESGFYAPSYAALAIKQGQGDPAEAVFLLCAYRSTLPRNYYSSTVYTSDMRVIRRISSSFKDIPGGQMLGPTYDYTHRLLRFDLMDENDEQLKFTLDQVRSEITQQGETPTFRKVADLLREQGLIAPIQSPEVEREPFDVTRQKVQFPTTRQARLQLLARGETGAMTAFAYSSMRGFGTVHPTIGELRVGYLAVSIPYPYAVDDEDSIYIGEVLVTEVESINSFKMSDQKGEVQFSLGYGLCFGQNEVKAISMSILERSLETPGTGPTHDEEFILLHINSPESNGFVSHLKLPHYTTFQASLDRIHSVKDRFEKTLEDEEGDVDGIEQTEVPIG